jgi:hypothetical protein
MRPAKNVLWKVISYGAGTIAALVTRKVLAAVWTGVADEPPPNDLGSRRVSWTQALTWGIAAGVGMAVTRVVVMRTAATVWEAVADEPPPGEESGAA